MVACCEITSCSGSQGEQHQTVGETYVSSYQKLGYVIDSHHFYYCYYKTFKILIFFPIVFMPTASSSFALPSFFRPLFSLWKKKFSIWTGACQLFKLTRRFKKTSYEEIQNQNKYFALFLLWKSSVGKKFANHNSLKLHVAAFNYKISSPSK